MPEINYTTMSNQAVREYFLEHRNEQLALQAYLERRNEQPRKIITKVGDSDFDLKIAKAIEEKLKQRSPLP